jgi:hypothetical protein
MTHNIVKTNRKQVWKDLLALARCDFSAPSARTDSGMLVDGFRDAAFQALLAREPACFIDAQRTPRLCAAVERFNQYNNNK